MYDDYGFQEMEDYNGDCFFVEEDFATDCNLIDYDLITIEESIKAMQTLGQMCGVSATKATEAIEKFLEACKEDPA